MLEPNGRDTQLGIGAISQLGEVASLSSSPQSLKIALSFVWKVTGDCQTHFYTTVIRGSIYDLGVIFFAEWLNGFALEIFVDLGEIVEGFVAVVLFLLPGTSHFQNQIGNN